MSFEQGPNNKFTQAADALKASQITAEHNKRSAAEAARELERTRKDRIIAERQANIDRLLENGVLSLFVEAAKGIREIYPDVQVHLTVPDGDEFSSSPLKVPSMGVALLFDFKRESKGNVSYTRIGATDYGKGAGFQLNYGSELAVAGERPFNSTRKVVKLEPIVEVSSLIYQEKNLEPKALVSKLLHKPTKIPQESVPMPGYDYFEYTDEGLVEAADVVADLIESGDASKLRATSFSPRHGLTGMKDLLMHDSATKGFYSHISVPLE